MSYPTGPVQPVDPNQQAGPGPCYRHPDRITGVRCVRCNRPICSECMRPASVGFQCPDDVRAGRVVTRTPGGGLVRLNTSLVTWSLIAINVVVYLATALTPGGQLNNPAGSRLFGDLVLFPPAVAGLFSPNGQAAGVEQYRLLTGAFLHLSLLHIASNMFVLFVLGPFLERYFGRWRYLAIYLVAALGGGVFVYAFGALNELTAGASGAIFGLFAVAAVFHKQLGLNVQWLVGTLVINIVLTISVPGISVLGHVGGFVTGGVVAGLLLLINRQAGRRATRIPRAVFTAQQSGALAVVLVVLAAIALWRTLSLT